jgi:hypothetical protein
MAPRRSSTADKLIICSHRERKSGKVVAPRLSSSCASVLQELMPVAGSSGVWGHDELMPVVGSGGVWGRVELQPVARSGDTQVTGRSYPSLASREASSLLVGGYSRKCWRIC